MAIRAVLDTNVLVSGLISSHGSLRAVIDGWLAKRFALITSPYLIQEFNHVLTYPRIASRLRLSEQELTAFLSALLLQSEIVPGHLRLPGVTRDPKDDAVVACAVEGKADAIVSGDGDLLAMDGYEDIRVYTPQEFLAALDGE